MAIVRAGEALRSRLNKYISSHKRRAVIITQPLKPGLTLIAGIQTSIYLHLQSSVHSSSPSPTLLLQLYSSISPSTTMSLKASIDIAAPPAAVRAKVHLAPFNKQTTYQLTRASSSTSPPFHPTPASSNPSPHLQRAQGGRDPSQSQTHHERTGSHASIHSQSLLPFFLDRFV